MLKLTVYIPEPDLETVKTALFEAGAGRYGGYDCCCWEVKGVGQFRPLEGSRPCVGRRGEVARVVEYRVEMICEDTDEGAVRQALLDAHPYEVPAFDFVRVSSGSSV